jgi:hypothetical protein
MGACHTATGAGIRDAAVEAMQHLPDLAAVALAHVVDYLRSFQSEGVLQQVSAAFVATVEGQPKYFLPSMECCRSSHALVVRSRGCTFCMLQFVQCAAFRPFQDARCMTLLPNALRQLEVTCTSIV